MNHYAVHNVTAVCHMSVHAVIKSIAHISETFVYVYLGLTGGISVEEGSHKYKWHAGLIFLTSFLCFISRAVHIFPFSNLANYRRKIPYSF
eukprot:UN22691